MANKATHILINAGNVVGIVYGSDTYGRTLVLRGKLNPDYNLKVWDKENAKEVADVDLMEFIHSLLPKY
jgi:hypothetical protein